MIPQSARQRLRVVARYDAGGGIEVEGTSVELRRLSELLSREEAATSYELTVPATEPAAPYDGFLTALHVVTRNQKARVSRHGEAMHVEGSKEALAVLSHNIAFLANQADEGPHSVQPHVHVEYYDGHPYLAADSEPLTVSSLPSRDAGSR